MIVGDFSYSVMVQKCSNVASRLQGLGMKLCICSVCGVCMFRDTVCERHLYL